MATSDTRAPLAGLSSVIHGGSGVNVRSLCSSAATASASGPDGSTTASDGTSTAKSSRAASPPVGLASIVWMSASRTSNGTTPTDRMSAARRKSTSGVPPPACLRSAAQCRTARSASHPSSTAARSAAVLLLLPAAPARRCSPRRRTAQPRTAGATSRWLAAANAGGMK